MPQENKYFWIILIAFLMLNFFMPVFSYADPAEGSKLAGKICDIRQLFCGGLGIGIATFAIFSLGILAMRGGIHWSLVLIVIIGLILFVSADIFVSDLTGGNVDANCECF